MASTDYVIIRQGATSEAPHFKRRSSITKPQSGIIWSPSSITSRIPLFSVTNLSDTLLHHNRMTSRRREPPSVTYCSLKLSRNRLQVRATCRRVFGYRISITHGVITRAPSRSDTNHAARRFGEQLNRTTNGADTSTRSEHC